MYNLSINVLPFSDIETDTNAIRVIQFGDSVVLECTVYGDSSIGIDWTFDGSSYTSSVEDSSYDSEMYCLKSNITLSSVADVDDGDYVCAHSQDSSLDFDFTLDVYSKSKLTVYNFNNMMLDLK